MSRAVSTATKYVTSNDDLTPSLEGIECLMIESMYHNNAGNLRRAWLTNRRAMATAQLLGLHNDPTSARITFLEDATRNRIEPAYMWFRLVASDRYLSLMLGLPQGSPESTFADLEAKEDSMAIERMERLLVVAAGLILRRNNAQQTDLKTTYQIDGMLREAADLMPPQWWLTPDFACTASSNAEAFDVAMRITCQFAYHHLLAQLHLPNMIQPFTVSSKDDYSKMTATNASRAIVSMFVTFRTVASATAYCRGIDFIAFIASTTLCLAHIDAHRCCRSDDAHDMDVSKALRHQRLSDRGLLERTLDILERMAYMTQDIVAQQISSILRPLLLIEDKSAKGTSYYAGIYSEFIQQRLHQPNHTPDDPNTLEIQVPYFGTVKIGQDPTIQLFRTMDPQTSLAEGSRTTSDLQTINIQPILDPEPVLQPDRQYHYQRQTDLISQRYSTGRRPTSDQSLGTQRQTDALLPTSSIPPQQSEPAQWELDASASEKDDTQDPYHLAPGLSIDVDEWALQGVEMAFFNNFTHDLTH